MADKVKRMLSIFGKTCFITLLLAVVCAFALSALGIVRLVPVLSNSMAPAMPVGSLAVTLPVPSQQIQPGDVIVFTAPDGTARRIIHRTTSVIAPSDARKFKNWEPDRLYLETKGDNNPAADPWIVSIKDPVLWRETKVIPFLGWPFIWSGNPLIRLAAFTAAGAVLAAWAIMSIWRRDEQPPASTTDLTAPQS